MKVFVVLLSINYKSTMVNLSEFLSCEIILQQGMAGAKDGNSK
jgi:hypothetical protein